MNAGIDAKESLLDSHVTILCSATLDPSGVAQFIEEVVQA